MRCSQPRPPPWESIRKQNDHVTDFIRGTFGFVDARKDAARQNILVKWALGQIPLIDAEPSAKAQKGKRRRAIPTTTAPMGGF